MSVTLFKLPYPSVEGTITLEEESGRLQALLCEWEAMAPEALALIFEQTIAFRCAYEEACRVELMHQTMDRVVNLGSTAWLAEVEAAAEEEPGRFKHLAICLEEGPCYEFICRNFRTEQGELE